MIWIDITNLPHVPFFKDFIKNNDCLVTCREFEMLTSLLDKHEIEYTTVGRHGGKDPKEKLFESANRIKELAKIVESKKIKIAVAKHSVESPRVAFGLDIPSFFFLDNEYAFHQNKLTLPLAEKVIIPHCLDKEKIIRQGATSEHIREFYGVFEQVQVKNFKPDKNAVDVISIKEYVLIRPPPFLAAYFDSRDFTQKVVDGVNEMGYLPIIIPRSNERYENALNYHNVDTLNLTYFASAVIGGGGTMNRESALLGTPTISYYPQEILGVDNFLIEEGLMVHCQEPGEIIETINRVVGEKETLRKKAAELMKKFEDPFQVLNDEIEKKGIKY